MFESLENDNLEYTLRLRHEVGFHRTWRTNRAAIDDSQTTEPRVSEKYVLLCVNCSTAVAKLHLALFISSEHTHEKFIESVIFKNVSLLT